MQSELGRQASLPTQHAAAHLGAHDGDARAAAGEAVSTRPCSTQLDATAASSRAAAPAAAKRRPLAQLDANAASAAQLAAKVDDVRGKRHEQACCDEHRNAVEVCVTRTTVDEEPILEHTHACAEDCADDEKREHGEAAPE